MLNMYLGTCCVDFASPLRGSEKVKKTWRKNVSACASAFHVSTSSHIFRF